MRQFCLSLVLVVLVGLLCATPIHASKGKLISVGIDCKWNTTSILSETAEFLANVSSSTFWEFVDTLSNTGDHPVATDREQYETSMKLSSKLLGAAGQAALELSLRLHSYSPLVELVHTIREHELERYTDLSDSTRQQLASCPVLIQKSGSLSCGGKDGIHVDVEGDMAELYPFDHVLPSSDMVAVDSPPPLVVVYGDLTSPDFSPIHREMVESAEKGQLRYVLRLWKSRTSSTPQKAVGFGVELAIKNMEYKVIDDSKVSSNDGEEEELVHLEDEEEVQIRGFYFQRLMERKPEWEEALAKFRDHLVEDMSESNIKAWDMNKMGLQATQTVMRSSEPLELFKDIVQNFPMYATPLTRISVDKELKEAVLRNHRVVPAGSNQAYLNGRPISLSNLDLFEVLEGVRKEATVLDALKQNGLSDAAIEELLKLELKPLSEQTLKEMRLRMEVEENGKSEDVHQNLITWINDLEDESDIKYKQWSPSINVLLKPGWPNQLRYVRRNLYAGIAIIDPTTKEGLGLYYQTRYFVKGNAPVRMGFVLKWEQEESEPGDADGDSTSGAEEVLGGKDGEWAEFLATASGEAAANEKPKRKMARGELVARCVYYLKKEHGQDNAISFMDDLAQQMDKKGKITRKSIRKLCERNAPLSDADAFTAAYKKMRRAKTCNHEMQRLKQYVRSRGLNGPEAMYVLNGVPSATTADTFRDVMMNRVLADQRVLQTRAYHGEIHDGTNFNAYWENVPSSVPRISPVVLVPSDSLTHIASDVLPEQPTAYMYPEAETTSTVVTYILGVDMASARGLALSLQAIKHVGAAPQNSRLASRLHLIHLSDDTSEPYPLVARFVRASQQLESGSQSLKCTQTALALSLKIEGTSSERLVKALEKLGSQCRISDADWKQMTSEEQARDAAAWVRTVDAADQGRTFLLANRRLIRIPDAMQPEEFADELDLLDYSLRTHSLVGEVGRIVFGSPMQDPAASSVGDGPRTEGMIADVSLVLLQRAVELSGSTNASPVVESDLDDSVAVSLAATSDAGFRFMAIVDPLSEEAQRLTSLAETLHQALGCAVKIYLNPRINIEKLPLERFYRFVGAPAFKFNEQSGQREVVENAMFRIFSRNVLTMGIDTPESWIVMSKYALFDLDNLKLSDVSASQGMQVVYQLEHLLLQGQALDISQRWRAPAGMQVWLGHGSKAHVQDTVIMENLGYLQLKAAPGVWKLRLAPGISDHVFAIAETDSGEEASSAQSSGRTKAYFVSSFTDSYKVLKVVRREGKEHVDLTKVRGTEEKGLWDKMKGFFGGSETNEGVLKEAEEGDINDKINIFSVASGHLYERFLKIMMLSVIKATDKPVKFWFIKNFLSPQFKDLVPKMAKRYGFEVELVTYKWPRWLRRQTEKQRIIWGYKILFLDVLFPLNLKRVIFTDADQVVRGDMNELQEMDLQGKPYAYTPFCDSNKDTEGFRFWKQGYWESHLRGKKYHISALYVVDLEEFRRMRAGDSLRSMYDNLSQDPNSLANLDQDLPNYAQHMVPIHSLPQEWLWCQTWCSMETLEQAKTIDLCNNPLTKIPKLDAAKSLLPEWVELDEEAKQMERDIHAESEAALETEEQPAHTHSEL